MRRSLVPLIVLVPPLFWVVDAARRVTLLTLGRDQGIFQYVAWAVAHGERDYGDVRDVNGPVIHMIHLAFLALGGADEQRFRQLDVGVSALAFFVAGAALADLAAERPTRTDRALWGAAGAVALLAQYFLYLYWDLAQRESFCDWFVLAALGLQLAGRARPALVAAAGALVALACFGKPTYAAFGATQLLALAVDRGPLPARTRFGAFALGAAGGALVPLAYLLAYADVRAFARVFFHDVPAMYRFIWPRSPEEIFAQGDHMQVTGTALVASALVLALVARGDLPRRAVAIALFPLAGIANVVLQRKGFPYHFHPVTAGTHLCGLALVAACARLARDARVGLAAAGALSLHLVTALASSPHVRNVWILEKGETAERRRGQEYLVYFRDRDFFPWELRQAAAYLEAHTPTDARVQTYGMDPYVLFLARRKSATPYIYAYDLDADAALNGGWSLYPTDAEQARIRAIRDTHEADLTERIERDPPAAFVFVDKAPLVSWPDARADFREHCPRAAAIVERRYRRAADFGEVHVLLRDDLEAPGGVR